MSNYFKYFPTTKYNIDNTKNQKTVRNIMLGLRIIESVKKNSAIYYIYTLKDGDRPDIVAEKYYKSVDYAWLVMLANNIVDPIYDWLLTQEQLDKFIAKKYGSLEYAKSNVKNYFDGDNFIVDVDTYNSLPAGNRSAQSLYEWEVEKNEKKRRIKIIDRSYLQQIESELGELF